MFFKSSIVNEDTRALLNLFIFFFFCKKISHAQKAQKRLQVNKNKKGSVFVPLKSIQGRRSRLFAYLRFCDFYAFCALCVKQKKDSIFMCIKTSKRKKIACLTFCAFYAFYAHKKDLRGGKLLVCVLWFLWLLCFLHCLCILCFLCV